MCCNQTLSPEPGDALVIVDLQIDFLPGGALPVPHGDGAIAPLNRYVDAFRKNGLPVIVTRDAHPSNHCSFREHGGPWPAHCVIGTSGVELAPALKLPPSYLLVSKGMRPDREEYSDFGESGLQLWLQQLGVSRLWIGGLATDYCVRTTVLDALTLGFRVIVPLDAICAIDVRPGDGERAIHEMFASGAVPVHWDNSKGTIVNTSGQGNPA